MRTLLEWVRDILIAFVIAILVLTFFRPVTVQQESMQPTFYEGDYVVIGRLSYKLFGDPERGDIIVFESGLYDDNYNAKNLIKRVVALPGETIEIREDIVYINDNPIEEQYMDTVAGTGDMDKMEIPYGCVFVMGDNRAKSEDSRSATIGFVKMDSVLGKVKLRVYPFSRIKFF